MNRALTLLALSDDHSVIRALEYFNQQIRQGLDTTFEELLVNNAFSSEFLPDEQSLEVIKQLDSTLLDEVQSQSIARRLFFIFANEEKLSPLVLDALENWPDQTKKVGATLQFGLAASLLLIVASTEVQYNSESFNFHKKPVSAEQIKAVAQIIQSFIKVKSGKEKPSDKAK